MEPEAEQIASFALGKSMTGFDTAQLLALACHAQ
jgi:hypothetical protein